MKSRFVKGLICFVALTGIVASTGCSTSAAQARQRQRSWGTDKAHLVREIDWLVGIEDESILWDASVPPYW